MPIRSLFALAAAAVLDAGLHPLWVHATPLPPCLAMVLLWGTGLSTAFAFAAGAVLDAYLGTWGLFAGSLTIFSGVPRTAERIPIFAFRPTRMLLTALAIALFLPLWRLLSGSAAGGLAPLFFALQTLLLPILFERPGRESLPA